MSADTNSQLLLLFDRPLEPTFMPKGILNQVFDVPEDYLVDKYKSVGRQLISRFGDCPKVPLRSIPPLPLGDVLALKKDEAFSVFIPKHQIIAGKLIDIFLGEETVDKLMSAAVYARDRVNPHLFIYSLTVALLHRPDTKDMKLPSLIFSFPEKFFEAKVINDAKEMINVVPEDLRSAVQEPIISMTDTATDLEIEHRVAYFREDPGVNLHHSHWHAIYPSIPGDGQKKDIVKKNRRGELFYYMHQQLIARYNFERFCNNLRRVRRLKDFRTEIEEAYFPKLLNNSTGMSIPGRVANQKLSDLSRQNMYVDVEDLERWRDRLFEAIAYGKIKDAKENEIKLTKTEGIDVLGDMVESSILSPNRDLYGDIHNLGHVFLSVIHDPDRRHLEEPGVMGDFSTAMRDPIFYRWHAFIDDIFQTFKYTLPSYSWEELNFQDIIVEEVTIQGEKEQNVINTMWELSKINISPGLNFQPRGSLFVQFRHLQHEDFSYNIVIINNTGGEKKGTCRIFLAPALDERKEPFSFNDQRQMFIEMDKFTVTLKPGTHPLTRKATDSSVTISFNQIFHHPDNQTSGNDKPDYCGCGWPDYMLVPKGAKEGFPAQLFVMISDYEVDKVDGEVTGACKDADSFCGLKDKKYPDSRAMGYPFDRKVDPEVVHTFNDFRTPNMFLVDNVRIVFTDEVIDGSN